MKECKKCNTEKELEEFHRHPTAGDRRQTVCKVCRNKAGDKYREANREEERARARRYNRKNPEKRLSMNRRWKQNNKGRVNAATKARQAAKLKRTPKWLTAEDKEIMAKMYELSVAYTAEGSGMYHVDHQIPLQGEFVCGLHVPENLQVIPAEENLRKSNKYG